MKFSSLIVVIASVLCVSASAQDSHSNTQAQAAASIWVTLIDEGKYSESWKQAAEVFKSAVSEQSWIATIGKVRAPLGALKSRALQSSTFTHTLPGAPNGEYVVIKFSTQFENKAAATETVIPSREKDGSWHVSGYFIK